jgi:hypothetical protein
MEFTRAQIGDGQFLLANQVRQRFIYPTGDEVENATVYTNCREFRGNSTVTFGPATAPVTEGDKKTPTQPLSLPRGLRFSLGLKGSINIDKAAAGDPFSATLADALRDSKGKVLAPKGALVEGRLLRVQNFARPAEVVIVFKPEVVWVRGARVPLSAVLDWTLAMADRRRGKKGIEIMVPLPGEDNSGGFRFSGEHVVVPAGFRSEWRTASPATLPTSSRPAG